MGTLTYWRKSVLTPISEHWLIGELSPKSTTIGTSWPRTGKAPTGLSMLSKTGLILWQQWRVGCCQELGTSQTCKNSTHDNVSKMTRLVSIRSTAISANNPTYINLKQVQKRSGTKLRTS
ncbi:hypothetical protein BHM03_00037340 [Ensete ventricosum]|nr:hypothetical protein BHM03_00037340 [Ensete ventricosum]